MKVLEETWKRSFRATGNRWTLRNGIDPRFERPDHCRAQGQTVAQLLKQVIGAMGDQETVLSAIALVELMHGIHRADTPQRRAGRELFIQDLLIGATALHLGYTVMTGNPRHFQMIPGLVVKQP